MVSDGRSPAEAGVVGLGGRPGDRASGKGKEAELIRASRFTFSRWCGAFLGSGCARVIVPEDDGLEVCEREIFEGDFVECGLLWAGGSGALVTRLPPSFARLVLMLPEWTVCARTGIFLTGAGSEMVSSTGRGFLACATASGPAHWGSNGHATLARTKLAKTVTGSTFSVIFSCLAVSATPKTTCWTLL